MRYNYIRRVAQLAPNNVRGSAVVLIFWGALLHSLVPVSLDQFGSPSAPLQVGLGVIIGTVAYSEIRRRRILKHYPEWHLGYGTLYKHVRANPKLRIPMLTYLIILAFAGLAYVAFSASTAYVDTAVTASLYELWPMIYLILFRFVDRNVYGPHKGREHSWTTYALMAAGVPAIALVVYASTSSSGQADPGVSILGIGLAFVATLMAALNVATFIVIDRVLYRQTSSGTTALSQFHPRKQLEPFHRSQLDDAKEVISLASLVIARTPTIPIFAVLAIVQAGSVWKLFALPTFGGILVGLLLNGPGIRHFRRAHILSTHRELISVQYLTPIGALIWLALVVGIDIARMDLLVFGTVAVVAINMLINMDPDSTETGRLDDSLTTTDETSETSSSTSDSTVAEVQERHSLRALVIALLGSAVFIYFRDELWPASTFDWEPGNYWAALGLSATFFALLLAFRLTRVESTLMAENQRTFALIRNVELLPAEYFGTSGLDIRSRTIEAIRNLNRAASIEDHEFHYSKASNALGTCRDYVCGATASSAEDRRIVSDILAELDGLAYGRQHARSFAERLALWLIGFVVIALGLTVPTEVGDFAHLMSEIVAILLSAIVIYLLAHMADLRRSRRMNSLMNSGPQTKKAQLYS